MPPVYSSCLAGELGDEAFVASLELALGRRLRPQKLGPKPKASSLSGQLPLE
jgi:hypothetical protein